MESGASGEVCEQGFSDGDDVTPALAQRAEFEGEAGPKSRAQPRRSTWTA
ncbi:MAG: hypothetical protein WCP21_00685 [Armatimonadota bacterium]